MTEKDAAIAEMEQIALQRDEEDRLAMAQLYKRCRRIVHGDEDISGLYGEIKKARRDAAINAYAVGVNDGSNRPLEGETGLWR